MVRLARFAATYHMAQAPRLQLPRDVPAPLGPPRAITTTGIHLKLIPVPEAGYAQGKQG